MTEKKLTLGQAIDQIISALDSLEPDARKTALEAASSHLGINAPINVPQHTVPQSLMPSLHGTPAPQPLTMDIRTLKEQKQPKSARQMACVVAYYLRELAPESERSETVTAQNLTKYFKQAGFKLPKTIGQILPDAKVAGYFETASGKGAYALNAVGYNLVVHNLPSKKGE